MKNHEHYLGWIIEYETNDTMWVVNCYIERMSPFIGDKWHQEERHYVGQYKYPEIAHDEAKKLIKWMSKEVASINARIAHAFRNGMTSIDEIPKDEDFEEDED
jgi:hypothetical protein